MAFLGKMAGGAFAKPTKKGVVKTTPGYILSTFLCPLPFCLTTR